MMMDRSLVNLLPVHIVWRKDEQAKVWRDRRSSAHGARLQMHSAAQPEIIEAGQQRIWPEWREADRVANPKHTVGRS
jgi:hypothetical protein